MPQAGQRNPQDPYDARNPGVRPYRGSTDSELEEEERQRRRNDNMPPDYGGPGMPREPGMKEPWEKPVTSVDAVGQIGHMQEAVVQPAPTMYRMTTTPRWHQYMKKRSNQ